MVQITKFGVCQLISNGELKENWRGKCHQTFTEVVQKKLFISLHKCLQNRYYLYNFSIFIHYKSDINLHHFFVTHCILPMSMQIILFFNFHDICCDLQCFGVNNTIVVKCTLFFLALFRKKNTIYCQF